jgi:glycosyltransferase involved in cell wall biosynthesis
LRILIITQFFAPEIGATQTRLHSFAEGLAALGHDVRVLCEVPNHPQGVVHKGFAGRPLVRGRMGNFGVNWVWVSTSPEKTTRSRLLFYGSFTAMAAGVGALLPRPDVVFASSPPLPVGVAAWAVAAWHRVPWVFDVRDLWPEAAVALGELSNPRMLKMAERLERSLYRHADAITTVTAPFEDSIATKTDRGKISLLPNGTTRFWMDAPNVPSDRAGLGLPPDRFVWTYAGNVGPAQGLEAAIDAARLLDDSFKLLVLGEGASRDALMARACDIPAGQVEFRPQVQPEEARRYLRSSDCLLVPLADHPSLRTFVPSKLFDCCAVGRPVIVSAAGEPQRQANEAAAALPVDPGDPEALAAAVRRLRDDEDLRERLGRAGRDFAMANLRDVQVARLETVLQRVVASRA